MAVRLGYVVYAMLPSAPNRRPRWRHIVWAICWSVAGAIALAAAPPQPASPPRAQDVLDRTGAAPTSTAAPFNHNYLFELQPPEPLVWPPPAPPDPAREALEALETAPTNEFSAPPLIVTRIATLPAESGLSPQELAARYEGIQLHDTVTGADRLFREGHPTNAIELLEKLIPAMKTPRNQGLLLNRLAAYHFRLQQYTVAAEYMRRANKIEPLDAATACNLAAVLLAQGHYEEALPILEDLPPAAFSRPGLAFSIYFNRACAHSLRHDTDEAIANLARAAQADPASTAASLGDPQLDPIRNDKQFVSLRTSLEGYIRRAQAQSKKR